MSRAGEGGRDVEGVWSEGGMSRMCGVGEGMSRGCGVVEDTVSPPCILHPLRLTFALGPLQPTLTIPTASSSAG